MGMFSAKGENGAPPVVGGLSIIAAGMTVRGDIDSNNTVKVEGMVCGNVRVRQQVLVAKEGVVQGDIDAREAIVGGSVDGAIRATERVEIQSGATVSGDITTRRISVAEGGCLNGIIRMGEPMPEKAPVEAKPAAAARTENKPVTAIVPVRPSVPVARVAVPPRIPTAG
jgi:cytoskeletal protein CcmA (bactofilin family)